MVKISEEVINGLLFVGQNGLSNLPSSLHNENLEQGSLICGNEPWNDIINYMDAEKIENLIRGLVLLSSLPGRSSGGSVSPVIFLYKRYVGLSPINEPDLTQWVIRNRVNEYEPFGTTSSSNATSYGEYLSLEAVSKERRLEKLAQTELEHQGFRDLRKKKEADKATRLIANAVRRGDLSAVKAMLKKGASIAESLPDGGSLLTLAQENNRDLVVEFLKTQKIE